MPVQFAGSSSSGVRRRRRIVSGDGSADASLPESDAGEIESQLVASAAAAPWVPATEKRIWIYSSIIGLCLAGLTFAVLKPDVFHAELSPLTEHLLSGPRPLAVISAEALFLALSTQLGLLIGWYRARCKLDFGGRYRVWPWVVGLTAIAAFCLSSNSHHAFAKVVLRSELLQWRAPTVAWLLPFCVAALPIALLLDRDVRNSRSSLTMLRISGLLWLASACFEIYQPELQANSWFEIAEMLTPLFASATLFLGLWLHARVVAYVCPDPPELNQRSAWSFAAAALGWVGRRLMFWRSAAAVDQQADDDEDDKPKRRRKKVESEEATTKRKRKAPAKRPATRTRTRTKPADEESAESEELAESLDEAAPEESELLNEAAEEETSDGAESSWEESPEPAEEEEVIEAPPVVLPPTPAGKGRDQAKGKDRFTEVHKSHGGSVPAPHSRRQAPSWQEEQEREAVEAQKEAVSQMNQVPEPVDDYDQADSESDSGSDQMKGLSKRQKRDLKKQLRDQERSRGR